MSINDDVVLETKAGFGCSVISANYEADLETRAFHMRLFTLEEHFDGA